MNPEAQRLIAAYRLQSHPEGGWYRETYRSAERVTTSRGTVRSATTSIYFLLTAQTFSAFHRLSSDETWHFYRGMSGSHGFATTQRQIRRALRW